MISEFGEAPMSSTRRSSFFNLSNIHGRPSGREIYDRPSGPSILSSTRMSAVEPGVVMSILKEDDICSGDGTVKADANKHSAAKDGTVSPSRRDTLPAFFSRQTIRKSVSFRDVDEYFPVFSPDSPKQDPAVDDSQRTSHLAFDMTEYPDFLHSERMATVLHKQGIDVTSPDHVYVFCRASSSSTEEDLEKTVMSHCTFDDQERENVKENEGNIPEHQVHFTVGSSSSGTGSSHYSSCESDHYTSALEASIHPRHHLLPAVEEVCAGAGTDRMIQISTDSDSEFTKLDGNVPHVEEEPKIDIESDTKESLPVMLETMSLSEVKHSNNNVLDACSGLVVDTSSNGGIVKPVADTRSEAIPDLEGTDLGLAELSFTPSPFVTGRTRSRLSRCSLRTSRTPESLFSTSTLFEETLPTPIRTRRQTPRSQSCKDIYGSSPALCIPPSHSAGSSTGGDSLPGDCQDTQSSTLEATSSVNDSQADTLILSKRVTDSAGESQTLCDTVVLEPNQDNSVDAYERNLAEVILAMRQQNKDPAEGREFLTDDLTSADEITKDDGRDAPDENQADDLENKDGWITEDWTSRTESASSSSSSTYFSPRRSREDSDPTCTPGTGCTPRYSMSRLSSCRRPQSLANLSYTPGGRPHILDVDEPVEYLYTDTEQGHKLIETHVPPNADTSLSSSMSTTSSEDTILYDWRSLQTDMASNKGKENEKPQVVVQREKSVVCEDGVLPGIKGLTDKELRLRLMELGESPGPISSRTRPTYIRRLGRLLQETKSQSQHQQKHPDQPQTGKP